MTELVLASASRARQSMLSAAGVPFSVDVAAIDEEAAKESLKGERAAPRAVAETLAELKARRVGQRRPGALVLGCDQVLALGTESGAAIFDKPADRDAAAAQLRALSGRRHVLVSAAVVVRDGRLLWHHADMAELTMRPLSDSFIDGYLQAAGDDVLHSVGAYQLEGRGAQLFSNVRGDFFTVLGLPLLPLLGFLREHGVVPT
jgi:septum formation protein